jgi:hypothetical protein
MRIIKIFSVIILLASLSACEYGEPGGADTQTTYKYGDPEFERILKNMSGVWYSHYGAIRTDGYRIGRWGTGGVTFETEMGGTKLGLFPLMKKTPYKTCKTTGGINAGDFYVFYDDTVYGQQDDDSGGNGGWADIVTRYIGIVRAINIFNGDANRGAVIIEYLDNACPTWTEPVANGSSPFFGIFFRVINNDCIQMANAVNLSDLYAGVSYYTETATLEEAIAKNNASNEAEYISWGVVLPQDRE